MASMRRPSAHSTPSLNGELNSFYDSLHNSIPSGLSQTVKAADQAHINTFDRHKAVQVGSKLPDFTLLDATQKMVSKAELLAEGPILISFYRGGWCPFCNIELRALQRNVEKFHEQGVQLVAISPDAPDASLTRKQSMGLDFHVLSDTNNTLARQLGLINSQPEALRPMLASTDKSFESGSLDVPVPATLLVDADGLVREAFVNPKYHERLEPATALRWIAKMKG
jgi:peroxiredoxin